MAKEMWIDQKCDDLGEDLAEHSRHAFDVWQMLTTSKQGSANQGK